MSGPTAKGGAPGRSRRRRGTWPLAARLAALPLVPVVGAARVAGVAAGRVVLTGGTPERSGRKPSGNQRPPRPRAWVSVVADGAGEATREALEVGLAALRFAGGDAAPLRRELERGIERMQLVGDDGGPLAALPWPPMPEPLRRQARRIAADPPSRLLAALGSRNGDGGSSRFPQEVFEAMREEAVQLAGLAAGYPLVMVAMALHVTQLVASGQLSIGDVEAFLDGRRFRVREEPRENAPIGPSRRLVGRG